jgi:hypothetical protein
MSQEVIRLAANRADHQTVCGTTDKPTARVCVKCRVTKPLSDFAIDRGKPQGRRSACAVCRATYDREWDHIRRCRTFATGQSSSTSPPSSPLDATVIRAITAAPARSSASTTWCASGSAAPTRSTTPFPAAAIATNSSGGPSTSRSSRPSAHARPSRWRMAGEVGRPRTSSRKLDRALPQIFVDAMKNGLPQKDASDKRKVSTMVMRIAMSAYLRGWTEMQFVAEMSKCEKPKTRQEHLLWVQLRRGSSDRTAYEDCIRLWDIAVINAKNRGLRSRQEMREEASRRALLWADRITDGVDWLTNAEAAVMGTSSRRLNAVDAGHLPRPRRR